MIEAKLLAVGPRRMIDDRVQDPASLPFYPLGDARIVAKLDTSLKLTNVGLQFAANAQGTRRAGLHLGGLMQKRLPTTDQVIRRFLLKRLKSALMGMPDVRVIEEFGVSNGDGRVDIAVINGCLHGFEIKSDRDSLERLPDQIRLFSASMDAMTLVVGWRHVVAAMRIVPRWWGVQLADFDHDGDVILTELREPEENPSPNPVAVAALLWRNEALGLLHRIAADRGVRSKPRACIYERLASSFSLDQLRLSVLEQLKLREDWRFDARPESGDD
jgi:hypothetical protein